MKAYGYQTAHSLKNFSIKEIELPEPNLNRSDVLVRIKACSFNLIDVKIRQRRSSEISHNIILGWDASGIIEKVGPEVVGSMATQLLTSILENILLPLELHAASKIYDCS